MFGRAHYEALVSLLSLGSGGANEFLYTRQGRSPVIDGVDDTKELSNTRQAFALLGNTSLLLLAHQNVHSNPDKASFMVVGLAFHCFSAQA